MQPIIPSPVVGFSLATPNSGPEQAPSYVNFSPLFTSTPHPISIQQPVPISLVGNGHSRSPRLDALSRPGSQQPLTSIFSPSAFFSASRGVASDYPPHVNIDEPFVITPQQSETSVLDRYQRYANEHRSGHRKWIQIRLTNFTDLGFDRNG